MFGGFTLEEYNDYTTHKESVRRDIQVTGIMPLTTLKLISALVALSHKTEDQAVESLLIMTTTLCCVMKIMSNTLDP